VGLEAGPPTARPVLLASTMAAAAANEEAALDESSKHDIKSQTFVPGLSVAVAPLALPPTKPPVVLLLLLPAAADGAMRLLLSPVATMAMPDALAPCLDSESCSAGKDATRILRNKAGVYVRRCVLVCAGSGYGARFR
jgi:hypothetical protein